MAPPGRLSTASLQLGCSTFLTPGRHSLDKKIVCPKLRVSPLNTQIESSGVTMQSLYWFKNNPYPVWSFGISKCEVHISDTLFLRSLSPPACAIQDRIPDLVLHARPVGAMASPAPATSIEETGLCGIYHHLFYPWDDRNRIWATNHCNPQTRHSIRSF